MGNESKLIAAVAAPEEQRDHGAKTYEKPAIVFREPIEAKAAVCVKTGEATCGATGPYIS